MDNYDLKNFDEGGGLPPNSSAEQKLIPFDDSDPDPAPVSNPVSRKPLDLGGGKPPKTPTAPASAPAAPRPAKPPVRPAPAPVARPVVKQNPSVAAPTDRITGMKIFITKLHHGSLEFLEGQIATWLKEHPEVSIKRTDVAVGEVQAKKTEPNLIINVWY